MKFVPADCGTCGHSHIYQCDKCACRYVTINHTVDVPDDQPLRDRLDLGGTAVLEAGTAQTIIRVLQQIENDIHDHLNGETRRNPVLMPIGLGPEKAEAERTISVDFLTLTDEHWKKGLGTDDAILIAGQWLAASPEDLTVAWALSANGAISVGGAADRRRAHIICAADIDGRTYSFTRQLNDGTLRYNVGIAPGWGRLMRGELDLDDPESVEIITADQLSKGHELCAHLMAVTRVALEERGELPPAEKPETAADG